MDGNERIISGRMNRGLPFRHYCGEGSSESQNGREREENGDGERRRRERP